MLKPCSYMFILFSIFSTAFLNVFWSTRLPFLNFCAWPRSNSHAGSATLAQEFTLAMTGSSQLQQIPPQQGNAMRFASNVSHVHHKMHQMFDTSNRTSQMRGWYADLKKSARAESISEHPEGWHAKWTKWTDKTSESDCNKTRQQSYRSSEWRASTEREGSPRLPTFQPFDWTDPFKNACLSHFDLFFTVSISVTV